MDIDEDVEIKDDFENIVELMIMPRRNDGETSSIFLELAFPINFNLCSNEPGTVADSIDFSLIQTVAVFRIMKLLIWNK